MNKNNVLKKPVITEKSLTETSNNRFTFLVDPRASKHQIKKAIEDTFSVKVIKIRTNTKKPVLVRTGRRRIPTTTSLEKKAIVELKPGDTIKHFELQD